MIKIIRNFESNRVAVKFQGRFVRIHKSRSLSPNLSEVFGALRKALKIQIRVLGYFPDEVQGKFATRIDALFAENFFSFKMCGRWKIEDEKANEAIAEFVSGLISDGKIDPPRTYKSRTKRKMTPHGELVEVG